MLDQSTIFKSYSKELFHLSKRLEIVDQILRSEIDLKMNIVRGEVLALQFRKILENTAMLSLIANVELYSEANEKFKSNWHANRILKDVEKFNPNFYPHPVNFFYRNENNSLAPKFQDNFSLPYLSKPEFEKLYDHCSEYLHCENPFGKKNDWDYLAQNGFKFHSLIKNLLNNHSIMLPNQKTMILGVLKDPIKQIPLVWVCDVIEEGEQDK